MEGKTAGAHLRGVVGVTTPTPFGKEGNNFALFSLGQSNRLLNVIYNEFYVYSCLCLLFHQMQQVTEIDKDKGALFVALPFFRDASARSSH